MQLAKSARTPQLQPTAPPRTPAVTVFSSPLSYHPKHDCYLPLFPFLILRLAVGATRIPRWLYPEDGLTETGRIASIFQREAAPGEEERLSHVTLPWRHVQGLRSGEDGRSAAAGPPSVPISGGVSEHAERPQPTLGRIWAR